MAPPLKIKTVDELQRRIDEYFAARDEDHRPVTVTGLALAIGLSGRQALIEYSARNKQMGDAISRAKARCEQYAEERLYDRDGARGAEFSLACNFKWRKAEPETTLTHGGVVFLPAVSTDSADDDA